MISTKPYSACNAPRATIIDSVVQLGLAMMPLGRNLAAAALTSGTTSGTSGSIRNAAELSTTTAPRVAAIGAHCADTSSGTSNMATSTPSKTSSDRATTSTSSPRRCSRLPADRGEATRRISPHTFARVESRSSITVPTAPVAPTTARVGMRSLLMTGSSGVSSARPPVHNSLGLAHIEVEGGVDRAHCVIDVLTTDDDRDADLRGGDHLDVHTRRRERAEERCGHTGMRAHARPDQRDLADAVVVEQVLETDGRPDAVECGHCRLTVGLGQGERDVRATGRGR